jgi:hypothetical protein
MLATYLYATTSVADRLLDGHGRVLRGGRNNSSSNTPIAKAKRTAGGSNDLAVTKLEKEMDKVTDQDLLGDAKELQQGMQVPAPLPWKIFKQYRARGRNPLVCIDQLKARSKEHLPLLSQHERRGSGCLSEQGGRICKIR